MALQLASFRDFLKNSHSAMAKTIFFSEPVPMDGRLSAYSITPQNHVENHVCVGKYPEKKLRARYPTPQ